MEKCELWGTVWVELPELSAETRRFEAQFLVYHRYHSFPRPGAQEHRPQTQLPQGVLVAEQKFLELLVVAFEVPKRQLRQVGPPTAPRDDVAQVSIDTIRRVGRNDWQVNQQGTKMNKRLYESFQSTSLQEGLELDKLTSFTLPPKIGSERQLEMPQLIQVQGNLMQGFGLSFKDPPIQRIDLEAGQLRPAGIQGLHDSQKPSDLISMIIN